MSFKDFLFGKKDEGTPDRRYEMDQSLRDVLDNARGHQISNQNYLMGEARNWQRRDSSGLAAALAGSRENLLRTQARDSIRYADDDLAKRGLSGSSLGLRARLSADRGLRDSIGQVRSSIPLWERQLESEKLQNMLAASGGINSTISGVAGAQDTVIPGIQGTGLRSGGFWNDANNMAGSFMTAYTGNSGWSRLGQSTGNAGSNFVNNT